MTSKKSEPLLAQSTPVNQDPQCVEARGETLGKPEPLLTREEMDARAKKWVDDYVERREGSICS
jgi:hypothetical protein